MFFQSFLTFFSIGFLLLLVTDENPSDPSIAAAARRLGLHYLQRYFFLIAFRVFLDSGGARGQAPVAFSEWVAQRREITYLLSNLELE